MVLEHLRMGVSLQQPLCQEVLHRLKGMLRRSMRRIGRLMGTMSMIRSVSVPSQVKI